MFDKLKGIEDRFYELETFMSDPDIVKNIDKYNTYVKEHSHIAKIVYVFKMYKSISADLSNSLELSTDSDPDMRLLAIEDVDRLNKEKIKLEKDLKELLLPKDPMANKNIILEIRAGTGGDEASLFVSDLLKMYQRYSEIKGWKVEILSYSSNGIGGIKEVIATISGLGVYSRLRYESGTHRVQRVPSTETQGRIHTSAVTVAVLPEAEEIEVKIDPNEIRIDVFRSSGPGGQSVNTTDSAVRITHLSTGLIVTCQDEKSQHKNKAKAMKVLRSRLLDKVVGEQNELRSSERKNQVGSGDRSERIRTYNFPQARVTDHRISLTLYKLELILRGEIDEIIDPLITFYQGEALQNAENVITTDFFMEHS